MFDEEVDTDEVKGVLSEASEDYYSDMLPRGYLSVSQVAQYLKCGEAYRRRYVLEQPVPKSSYAVQGSGVHRAAEALHNSMIEETPIKMEEAEAVYVDYHDAEIADAVISEKEGDAGKVKDVGVALTRTYYTTATHGTQDENGLPIPPIKPVVAEQRFKVKLVPETQESVPFVGIVDLVEEDSISDIKVKGKPSSAAEVEDNLQLSLYAHIIGKPHVRLDQLVRPSKTKGPRYIRKDAVKTKSETLHAVDIVAEVASDIAAGRFRKTNPENWWCSEKWCPYWKDCRGRKR